MKKEIFRAGDYIEIIEPKFVKRVGYPIHPSDFYETLKRDPNVLAAEVFMVHAKKVVKTGIRVPPCIGGYNSFDGEHEYEPGYLEGEKTHVLLDLILHNGNVNFKDYWIETCNVKKM